jgi:hypothetical protein
MKRIILILMLLGGCVGYGRRPDPPVRLPLVQSIKEIIVEPIDPALPKVVIKDRDRIDAIARTLEGGPGTKWQRPADDAFPAEKYQLTFMGWNHHTRGLLLGDDWFGGYSDEKLALRRLSRQEQEDLSMLLGVELKLKEAK